MPLDVRPAKELIEAKNPLPATMFTLVDEIC